MYALLWIGLIIISFKLGIYFWKNLEKLKLYLSYTKFPAFSFETIESFREMYLKDNTEKEKFEKQYKSMIEKEKQVEYYYQYSKEFIKLREDLLRMSIETELHRLFWITCIEYNFSVINGKMSIDKAIEEHLEKYSIFSKAKETNEKVAKEMENWLKKRKPFTMSPKEIK